jgi:hypothetical protein
MKLSSNVDQISTAILLRLLMQILLTFKPT